MMQNVHTFSVTFGLETFVKLFETKVNFSTDRGNQFGLNLPTIPNLIKLCLRSREFYVSYSEMVKLYPRVRANDEGGNV